MLSTCCYIVSISCRRHSLLYVISFDQIVELKLQVPEVSMFLDFAKRVELCQSRCTEMLKGSITLKVGNLVIYVNR